MDRASIFLGCKTLDFHEMFGAVDFVNLFKANSFAQLYFYSS